MNIKNNKQATPDTVVKVFSSILKSIVKDMSKIYNKNSDIEKIINTFVEEYNNLIVNVNYNDYLQETTSDKQYRLNHYPKKLDEILKPVKQLVNTYY